MFHSLPDTSADSGYSLAAAPESPRRRLDVGQPVSAHLQHVAEEETSSPMFPGNPRVPVPCSPTPVRPSRQDCCSASVLSPLP